MSPIRRFAATARRTWWLFVVCVAVGVALAVVLGALKTTTYTASTQVLISAGDGGSPSTSSSPDPALNVADAQLVAESDAFFRQAAIPLGTTDTSLQKVVTVTTTPNTDALDFSVTVPSSIEAINDADTLAESFASYYTAFVVRSDPSTKVAAAEMVSPALTASEAAGSLPKDIAVGFFAGLVIAIFLVGVIESSDRTIRSPQEVDQALRLRAIYLPEGTAPARVAPLRQLTGQISSRTNGKGPMAVGVLAAGAGSDASRAVASLLAANLESEGLTTNIRDLGDGRVLPVGKDCIQLAVTNLAEASLAIGNAKTYISMWLVVVVLGETTQADLDQVRLMFASAGVNATRVVGVALASVVLPA